MPTIEPFWREWRELGAARRLVLAVAATNSGPLTKPELAPTAGRRASMVCDAVEQCFERLARPPNPDDAVAVRYLRSRLSQLARTCGPTDREGRERLLSTAVILWGDAVQHGRLREKLEQRAQALAGLNGVAKFQRVVMDVLWEAEAGDGVATKQRRRNWKGLRDVSFEILPSRTHDGDRCTLGHFVAVAEWVKRTRPHDRNLPRTPDAVGELFYLFCPCCVGVADPRLPGYGGPVQRRGAGVAEGDADAPEEAEDVGFDPMADEIAGAVDDVAPEGAAALVMALKAAIAELPPRDQVILSNLLGDFGIVGRAAKRAYPALGAETVKSRDRTAAVLGVTWQELAEDRRRMDDWLGDISRKLQHGPLLTRGAE